MAHATSDRRYTLTMTAAEAQTLLAVLANIYVDDQTPPKETSPYQQDIDNIIHIHEVLTKAGGLKHDYDLPLVAGD